MSNLVGRKRSDTRARKTYNVTLTARQRHYLRARKEGKTKLESALEAGYSVETAHNPKRKIESCRAVRAFLAAKQGETTNESLHIEERSQEPQSGGPR